MPDAIRATVIAALAVLLAGCTATYAGGAAPPPLTLRQQSLQTLDQASQLGSQAE